MTTQIEQANTQIDKIVAMRTEGKSQREIADELGLTQPIISLALRNHGGDPRVRILPSQDIELPAPAPSAPLVHLVARDPQQMAAARANLVTFLRTKRDGVLTEIRDLERARQEAKRNKWSPGSFNSAISKFRKQHDYYHKILEVVLAGYTLIPNFPIDVFAIRVTKDIRARTPDQYGGRNKADYLAETPEILQAGEGEYKSPKPHGYHDHRLEYDGTKIKKDDKGNDVRNWYFVSTTMRDPEFPFAVARPEIMDATAQAMALKLFDQIGICHQEAGRNRRVRGKGDPLIIGQVCMDVETYGWVRKPVSFLIAWHLDLRTL